MVEQAGLVGFGHGVVGSGLADTCRLELLEQRRGRAIQLRGELGDGGRCHGCIYPCVAASCVAESAGASCDDAACASAANQCSRAFMIRSFATSASTPEISISSSTARSASSSRLCTPPALS